ncbi:RlpA-like double-psi beta-barrel domain-containing protein [Sporobolomyces koalae]|uniref:RlpA-like double-psi beta-barrel domain-containing protein n=1 Tax=Sporobolomyces koalae TaxID=500713 RepID=UPI003178A8E1
MPVEALAPAVIEERDVLETRANKKVVKKPSQKTVKKAAKKAPAKPKSTPALYTSSSSFSGQATWFTQDGNPGSCGKWSNDNTLLVALNSPQVRASGNKCGSWVVVKNNANGKTVKAQVLDECPGCGWGSLDLSLGAFKALGNLDSGVLPISWSWA